MGLYLAKYQLICDYDIKDISINEKYFFDVIKTQTSIIKVDLSDRIHSKSFNNSIINNIVTLCEYYQNISYSRLFLKYNIEKTNNTITINNCISTLNNIGICLELSWPLNKDDEIPSDTCYNEAEKYKKKYTFSQLSHDLEQLKQCLIDGNPFMISIKVHKLANLKHISINKNDKEVVGGIVIMIVGYDDTKNIFKYLYDGLVMDIAYDYVTNSSYTYDIICLTNIEDSF